MPRSSYQIHTQQSLREVRGLADQGLSADEIERRLVSEGVDAERARWLTKRLRTERRLNVVRTLGIVLISAGLAGAFAGSILGLVDSPNAPAWLHMFAPMYAVLIGAGMFSGRSFIRAGVAIDIITLDSLPSELARRPRRVSRTNVLRDLFRDFAIAMATIVIATSLGTSYVKAREWSALRNRGVETTGRITARLERNTSRSTIRFIEYGFMTPGGEVKGRDPVSRSRYDAATIGEPVPVTYMPRRPEVSSAVRKSALTWNYLIRDRMPLLILLAVTVGSVVLMMIMLDFAGRRILRLAAQGEMTLGEIVDVNRNQARFEFDANGRRASGVMLLMRKKPRVKPEAGQRIAVVFDPANPKENAAVSMLSEAYFG